MFEQYLNYITLNSNLQALIILLLFIALAKIFVFIVDKVFRKLASKTETDFDDKLLNIVEKPVAILIVLIGLKISVIPLNFSEIVLNNVSHIVNTLIIIAATYAAILIIEIIFDIWARTFAKRTKSNLDDELLPLINATAKGLLYAIGFIVILHEWGVNIVPFLSGLGIAGLAVGLALQQTLANIFGGVSMILDKNIRVGDVVRMNDRAGTIYHIGLRTTRMKTFDNDMLIIPNGEMANSIIENYAQPNIKARGSFNVGVEYGNNPDRVKKVILKAIKKVDEVVDDPEPFVAFKEMGESSLDFTVYFWVKNYSQRFGARDKCVTAVYNSLEKNKIGIPFPTRTVYNIKGK